MKISFRNQVNCIYLLFSKKSSFGQHCDICIVLAGQFNAKASPAFDFLAFVPRKRLSRPCRSAFLWPTRTPLRAVSICFSVDSQNASSSPVNVPSQTPLLAWSMCFSMASQNISGAHCSKYTCGVRASCGVE